MRVADNFLLQNFFELFTGKIGFLFRTWDKNLELQICVKTDLVRIFKNLFNFIFWEIYLTFSKDLRNIK